MKRINIVAPQNDFGLLQDINILAEVISAAGWSVTFNGLPRGAQGSGALAHKCAYRARKFTSVSLRSKPLFDVNILLEQLHPAYFPLARVNCFIPNQEWFHRKYLDHLKGVDLILCKTRHAQEIFGALGCRTEHVSFTSPDRHASIDGGKATAFLHVAGRSHMKGTHTIFDLWLDHPEWPKLTVIQRAGEPRSVEAANIDHVQSHLSGAELLRLQNSCQFHLCPSEAEGFGHYICEAMSCGAVVLTTDAPPMNELIGPDRGLVVPYGTARSHHLSTSFQVHPGALKLAIEAATELPPSDRERFAVNARRWYEDNDRYFRKRLVEVLSVL